MNRIEGRLTKWQDDRGFGFIEPRSGGEPVFVHVSAFPRDGRRPAVGETLLFDIETDERGRKQARAVERPARVTAARRDSPRQPARSGSGLLGTLTSIALIAGFGWVIHHEYMQQSPSRDARVIDVAPVHLTRESYRCDGRQHCSQMTSCAEARYFLRNCPETMMDGDGDGIPCEQQWCSL
ncbi:MAG: cold shock domain-containing protein [Methyloversatilis sp.]|jgi:cold shock CspA family protein|nr:cold shock domain-containing protein [Methyloversatilis sp.]